VRINFLHSEGVGSRLASAIVLFTVEVYRCEVHEQESIVISCLARLIDDDNNSWCAGY